MSNSMRNIADIGSLRFDTSTVDFTIQDISIFIVVAVIYCQLVYYQVLSLTSFSFSFWYLILQPGL